MFRNKMLSILLVGLLSFVLVGCSSNANSESASSGEGDYPKRPITIIIPYAAGGSADIQARIISESLQNQLKLKR